MQKQVISFEDILESSLKEYFDKAIKVVLEDVFSDIQPMVTMYVTAGDVCDQIISSVGELDPDKYKKDIAIRDRVISVLENIDQEVLIEFSVDTFFYIDTDDDSEELEDSEELGEWDIEDEQEDTSEIVGL